MHIDIRKKNKSLFSDFVNSCIFIHDDSGDGIEYEQYGSNALLLNPKVCVVDTLKGYGECYWKYMYHLGITCSEIIEPVHQGNSILNNLLNDLLAIAKLKHIINNNNIKNISCFFAHDEFDELVALLFNESRNDFLHPNRSIWQKVNSKIFMRKLADELQVPIADGVIANNAWEVKQYVEKNISHSDIIVFKDPYRGGGKGICKALKSTYSQIYHDLKYPIVVEKYIDHYASPVSHWLVWNSTCDHLFTIDQIIDEFQHKGNLHPSVASKLALSKIKEYSLLIVKRLAEYSGVIGFDYVVDGNEDVYLVDMNGRFNSSTYPFYFTMYNNENDHDNIIKYGSIDNRCKNLSQILSNTCYNLYSYNCNYGIFLFHPVYDFENCLVSRFSYLYVATNALDANKYDQIVLELKHHKFM